MAAHDDHLDVGQNSSQSLECLFAIHPRHGLIQQDELITGRIGRELFYPLLSIGGLIDLKTEKVLWAVAKKPSEFFFLGGDKSTPELAEEIVGQMRKDLEKPGK